MSGAGIEGRNDDCENNQVSPHSLDGSHLRNARSGEVSEPTCTKTPDERSKKANADYSTYIREKHGLKHTAYETKRVWLTVDFNDVLLAYSLGKRLFFVSITASM